MKRTFLLRAPLLVLCIFAFTTVSLAQDKVGNLAEVKGQFKELLLDPNLFTKLAESHIRFENENGGVENISLLHFLGVDLTTFLGRMRDGTWDDATISFGFGDSNVSVRNSIEVWGRTGLLLGHLSVSSESGFRILVTPYLDNVFVCSLFDQPIASTLASAFGIKEPTANLAGLVKKLGNIDNGKLRAQWKDARLTVHGKPVMGEDGRPVTLAACFGDTVNEFLTMLSSGIDWEGSTLSFGLGDGQAVMRLSIAVLGEHGIAGRLMISPETGYRAAIAPDMTNNFVSLLLQKGIAQLLARAMGLPKAAEITSLYELQAALKKLGDSSSNLLEQLSGVEIQSHVMENGKMANRSVTLLEFFGGRENVATLLERPWNKTRLFLIVR